MKILFLGHSIVGFKPPFLHLVEELLKLGHRITLVVTRIEKYGEYRKLKRMPGLEIYRLPMSSGKVNREIVFSFPSHTYDVIYSAGEMVCEAGVLFRERFKVPLLSHAEWVPPFRVGLEDSKEWGYHNNVKIDTVGWSRYYRRIFQAWLQADMRTLAGREFVKPLEQFLGTRVECDFFYPFMETETANKLFNEKAKERYQIITIARLTPHKRIHMTIEALSLLSNPPLLVIIGGGKEKRFLKRLARKKKVQCKFLGEFAGEKKFRVIQESIFGVQIWSGIPPAEELLMGKPCITFDVPYMRELYGDALEYVPNNDVQALAKKIQFLINNWGVVKSKVESARQQILSHKLKIDTVANRALFLEKKLAELVGSKRD